MKIFNLYSAARHKKTRSSYEPERAPKMVIMLNFCYIYGMNYEFYAGPVDGQLRYISPDQFEDGQFVVLEYEGNQVWEHYYQPFGEWMVYMGTNKPGLDQI